MAKSIQGKVVYQNLGPGCWGIIDQRGRQWRPVNMPEQLKTVGAEVSVSAKEVEEGASIFMWGTPIEVISFHTLAP